MLYSTLTIIVCIIFFTISISITKKIINPISMLCLPWVLISFLSSLRLFTLYPVEDEIYMYFLWGITAFSLGFLLQYRFFRKNKHYKARSVKINYNLIYFLFVLCIVYVYIKIGQYGMSIFKFGLNLSAINEYKSSIGKDTGNSGLFNAFGFLVATPLFFPLTIFFVNDYLRGKRDKVILVLEIILIIGRIILYGGRYPFIQIMIAFIITMNFSEITLKSIAKKVSTKTRKKRVKYLVLIVLGILAFFGLTYSRTLKPFMTLYLDFSMQPYMFQYWAQNIGDSYAYGFASLFGFIHPVLYIFKNIGIISEFPMFFGDIYNNIQNTFQNWIKIGITLHANAYSSGFWYLFYDGRIWGICLGMAVFGIVSCVIFRKAYLTKNVVDIGNYILIAFAVLYMFTDMEFYKYDFVLSFFYLNCVVYKKRIFRIGNITI